MADLADIVDAFVSNPTRVRLVTDLFALLEGDAVLAVQGGIAGLLVPKIASPSTEGVDAHGRDVAAIVMELDQGERYAGVATPARTALSLYDAHVEWSPGIQDLEDEHGRDAVIRLVGLGLVAEALCDGGSDDAAAAWLETEAGRACLVWFAVVEMVLAYGTEDDPIDGDKLLDVLDNFFDDAIDEWTALATDTGLARARIIVNNWTDVLCPAITAAAPRVEDIAKVVRDALGDGIDVDGLSAEATSIALYRSLVARHIGELLHGVPDDELDETADSAETVHAGEAVAVTPDASNSGDAVRPAADGNQLRQCEQHLHGLRGSLDALNQSLMSRRDRRQRTSHQLDSIDKELASIAGHRASLSTELTALQTTQSDLLAVAGNESTAKAKVAFAAAQKNLQTAQSRLHSEREKETHIQTALEACASTLQASRVESRKTTRHCLRAVDERRRLCMQRVALLRDAADGTAKHLDKLLREAEDVHALRKHTKNAVSELRKERRRLGSSKATTTRQEGSLQKRLDERVVMVDTSRLAAREARDTVKRRRSSHKTSEMTLFKRVERVQAVQVRQASADTKVEDLSQSISGLREELRELMHHVQARRAEEEAERHAQLVATRKRKQTAEHVLSDGRERLPQLKETSKMMRAQITDLIAKERVAVAARDAALHELQRLQQQREDEGNQRQNQSELAVAALEMLKANAKRLEESHVGYRDAQAALDRFFKEQNLSESQKESLDREIAMARAAEHRAVTLIETSKAELAQTQSDIERKVSQIERAKQAVQQERKDRIQALAAHRTAIQSRIVAMGEALMEAEEDRRGLSEAEQKISTELNTLHTQRETVSQTKKRLLVQHTHQREQHQKLAGAMNRRREGMAALNGEIKGHRLTIRGLVSDRDSRKKRLAQHHGRIVHLQTIVDAAKRAEDDAVEEVADFQSWVDRSRASLGRNIAALAEAKRLDSSPEIPTPPVVPAGPSKASSKIDRLLAELQREREDPGPRTAEATMMVEREQLIAQAAVDEEATRILATSAAAKPAQAKDEDEDATVMFSPDELRSRLEVETEEDETVMFARSVPSKNKETE